MSTIFKIPSTIDLDEKVRVLKSIDIDLPDKTIETYACNLYETIFECKLKGFLDAEAVLLTSKLFKTVSRNITHQETPPTESERKQRMFKMVSKDKQPN